MTGVGLLTPLGLGTEATWEAVRAGKSGIGRITQFDASAFSCRIAGEVKGFDPAAYIEKKEIKKMGRFIQFAIAAAEWALADSGLQIASENAERVGVYIGSGIGGFEVIEREHRTLLEQGRGASPRFSFRPPSSTWLRARFPCAAALRGRIRPPPRLAPPARIPSAIRSGSSLAATPMP